MNRRIVASIWTIALFISAGGEVDVPQRMEGGKATGDWACQGSVVLVCRAQDKFPGESGEHLFTVCPPAPPEADAAGVRLKGMDARRAPKPFPASLVWWRFSRWPWKT